MLTSVVYVCLMRTQYVNCLACQRCCGYRNCYWKLVVFYTLCVVSLGVIYLVTHWKPGWRMLLTKSRCWLRDADAVLLQV